MRLKITKGFRDKLRAQVNYIAQDKPSAARKFKEDVIRQIKAIADMPYKNRKSIFFDRDEIRDLVFKGYIILYKVNAAQQEIEIFGFTKYEQNPFKE